MSRDLIVTGEGYVHTESGVPVRCPMGVGTCGVECAWFKMDMPIKLVLEKDGKTTIQSAFCGDKYIGTIAK